MPRSSAGILLFKVLEDQALEVLLVHPGGPLWMGKDEHAWSIPKGEYQPGEDPDQAAAREFGEELGKPVPEGARLDLGEVRQSGGKRVRVWAVEVRDFSVEGLASNDFEMEWPPRSGRRQSFPEVDRAEWMGLVQARTRLVRGQVDFLDRLAGLVAAR
jgi:predicted NUDIX family NTP pyrophosphohydrolase